jgi:hypothetical protein
MPYEFQVILFVVFTLALGIGLGIYFGRACYPFVDSYCEEQVKRWIEEAK